MIRDGFFIIFPPPSVLQYVCGLRYVRSQLERNRKLMTDVGWPHRRRISTRPYVSSTSAAEPTHTAENHHHRRFYQPSKDFVYTTITRNKHEQVPIFPYCRLGSRTGIRLYGCPGFGPTTKCKKSFALTRERIWKPNS